MPETPDGGWILDDSTLTDPYTRDDADDGDADEDEDEDDA
jgi:hypothetical protein